MHFSDDRGVPLYQRGSKGPEVRLLQQYLERAGYSPGGIDGGYGPNTEAAVTAFQRAYNLPADGVVYQDTFEALANVVSMRESIVANNKVVEVSTGTGPVQVLEPAAPLPPLAMPGTLPKVSPVVLALGAAASLFAFGWILTRKSPRPAMAGYSRRSRRRRR